MKEKFFFNVRIGPSGFRRNFLFLLFFFLLVKPGHSQQYLPLLRQLDSAITASAQYDTAKLKKIYALKLNKKEGQDTALYDHYLNLYDEYHIFSYDSAYVCAKKMREIARLQGNDSLQAYAKMKLGFILISSGMFKEAFDTLSSIPPGLLNKTRSAEYYTLMARCYYDLADYDQDDFYSPSII